MRFTQLIVPTPGFLILEPPNVQYKGKIVPLHAMKAYKGRGGIAALTLNVGARRRWVVGLLYFGKEPSAPLE